MADLHLGSILHIGKKVNSTLAELFNNAVFNAFKKLCDTAMIEKLEALKVTIFL